MLCVEIYRPDEIELYTTHNNIYKTINEKVKKEKDNA